MDNLNFSENLHEYHQKTSKGQALISFTLESVSKVSVEIYDLTGNKCALIPAQNFLAGEQEIIVDISSLGISPGRYVYYLQIIDENKTNRECRMMTID